MSPGLGQSINKCQASNVFLLCQPQYGLSILDWKMPAVWQHCFVELGRHPEQKNIGNHNYFWYDETTEKFTAILFQEEPHSFPVIPINWYSNSYKWQVCENSDRMKHRGSKCMIFYINFLFSVVGGALNINTLVIFPSVFHRGLNLAVHLLVKTWKRMSFENTEAWEENQSLTLHDRSHRNPNKDNIPITTQHLMKCKDFINTANLHS